MKSEEAAIALVDGARTKAMMTKTTICNATWNRVARDSRTNEASATGPKATAKLQRGQVAPEPDAADNAAGPKNSTPINCHCQGCSACRSSTAVIERQETSSTCSAVRSDSRCKQAQVSLKLSSKCLRCSDKLRMDQAVENWCKSLHVVHAGSSAAAQ
eukprot:3441540-Amphidinium_carterae.1